MIGASLIVLLATWCTVSSAQPVVTQEPSMSASPGQTFRFSCSMSSATVTNYWQSWYQQKPGSSPRLLYYYYSSASAGSGDLSRFSASKEASQNTWYLTISNMQAADEADYYCAVWYAQGSKCHSDAVL
uniref:Ig-like domain-containing protein n=1 Tax=Podarcis muralis TaxID=64176 RepID=A0A670JVB5_PODMU